VHVEDDEMQKMVREEGLEVLHPEYRTKPRVYYKNLDRYFKAFVGGSIAGAIGGITECIEGARVSLHRGGQKVAEARSDPYGDFKFQGLDEGSGRYRVEILDERFEPKRLEFDLGESSYLGVIELAGKPATRA
jgi:hypothetical protein